MAIVLFFVTSRYRMPIVPLLAVLAGMTIMDAIRAWRGSDRRALIRFTVILVGVALVVGLEALQGRVGVEEMGG